MTNMKRSFKERIRSGENLFGVSIAMNPDKGWLQDIVSRRPYDFVSVDAQHSPFNEERLGEFCELAQELEVPVLFRIKHTRFTFLIGNMLDLGPTAIEVPQVEREETVNEAVANFYYPPQGVRSWGGSQRLAYEGQSFEDYAALWGNIGALSMQIESVSATTSARSFAKKGVDFFTIGPADMTFDLARHPNHSLSSVDDCVSYLVRELRGTGAHVCMRTNAGSDPSHYHAMGVTMILESIL